MFSQRGLRNQVRMKCQQPPFEGSALLLFILIDSPGVRNTNDALE